MEKIQKYYEKVGYDPEDCNPPEPVYKYNAYLKVDVRTFFGEDAEEKAKEFSYNTEKILLNREEIDSYKNKRQEKYLQAVTLFEEDMRKEFNYLTDEQYDICYEYAYNKVSIGGISEVYNYMNHYAEFIEKVLQAN